MAYSTLTPLELIVQFHVLPSQIFDATHYTKSPASIKISLIIPTTTFILVSTGMNYTGPYKKYDLLINFNARTDCRALDFISWPSDKLTGR